jgi:hypothetical protein
MSGVAARVGRVWSRLTPEQRMAAISAILLLLSMLLPWYQETGSAIVDGKLASVSDSKNAFQVYSFVEAAIFVVAVGVLVLLWMRGEGRAFHLPGGDGTVIMVAGLWVMFLIFFRQLDKPAGRHEGMFQTSVGVQWGIFVAFLLGALLAWNGVRIRARHTPEPRLEDDVTAPTAGPAGPRPPEDAAPTAGPAGPRPREDAAPTVVGRRPGASEAEDGNGSSQLSFDEPPESRAPR